VHLFYFILFDATVRWIKLFNTGMVPRFDILVHI